MTNISTDMVRKIARLARVSLDDAALEGFRQDLSGILDWMRALEEVDTDAVEPFSHKGGDLLSCAREEDAPVSPPARDALLANAPESRDGCFVVPKILE